MALREVKKYYYSMLGQYVDLKNDLKDFEQAVKDGNITEDRLAEVKEEFERIKENYDRIAYIMFLFEQPNRKSKQKKYSANTKSVADYFAQVGADLNSVSNENKSIISDIKEQLKKITDNK